MDFKVFIVFLTFFVNSIKCNFTTSNVQLNVNLDSLGTPYVQILKGEKNLGFLTA